MFHSKHTHWNIGKKREMERKWKRERQGWRETDRENAASHRKTWLYFPNKPCWGVAVHLWIITCKTHIYHYWICCCSKCLWLSGSNPVPVAVIHRESFSNECHYCKWLCLPPFEAYKAAACSGEAFLHSFHHGDDCGLEKGFSLCLQWCLLI